MVIGDKGRLDRTRTDSAEGEKGHRKIDEGWIVGEDRDERSRGYYENQRKWESRAAGFLDKGTGSGSNWRVADSSGRETGQERHGARHQDDQR
jgi:hypothetical protein